MTAKDHSHSRTSGTMTLAGCCLLAAVCNCVDDASLVASRFIYCHFSLFVTGEVEKRIVGNHLGARANCRGRLHLRKCRQWHVFRTIYCLFGMLSFSIVSLECYHSLLCLVCHVPSLIRWILVAQIAWPESSCCHRNDDKAAVQFDVGVRYCMEYCTFHSIVNGGVVMAIMPLKCGVCYSLLVCSGLSTIYFSRDHVLPSKLVTPKA